MTYINDLAKEATDQAIETRNRKYDGTANAAFDDEYLKIAMLAEWAFAKATGLLPDLKERAQGDGGVDFEMPLLPTVDVKGMKFGYKYLTHKVGKPLADIYVLYECDVNSGETNAVGWAWGTELAAAEQKKLRADGYLSYVIHRDQLHPMADLAHMMVRRRKKT